MEFHDGQKELELVTNHSIMMAKMDDCIIRILEGKAENWCREHAFKKKQNSNSERYLRNYTGLRTTGKGEAKRRMARDGHKPAASMCKTLTWICARRPMHL